MPRKISFSHLANRAFAKGLGIIFPWVHVLPKRDITYSHDLLYTYHNADFVKDPKFAKSYAIAKKVGGALLHNYDIEWRLYILCWCAERAAKLEGDFVDCGVATGFCPRAVCEYTSFEKLSKKYYLMDTFQGLDPNYSTAEEYSHSQKETGYNEPELDKKVEKTFKDFKNVSLIKGSIPDTLPDCPAKKIAYLSIDMNCVEPEVAALEYFWDKMVTGGMIILDDYGYPGFEAQKHAHDTFAASKGVSVLSLPTCQGLIIKP